MLCLGTGRDHGYAGVRRSPEHFTFTFTHLVSMGCVLCLRSHVLARMWWVVGGVPLVVTRRPGGGSGVGGGVQEKENPIAADGS